MSVEATPSEPAFFCRTNLWIGIGLAVLTFIAFAGVWNHGFVDYDDNDYVFKNTHVQEGLSRAGIWWSFSKFHSANWHPLTWMSLQLDHEIYGLDPRGYHLTNLLLHLLNAFLLFHVFHRMTGALWRSAVLAGLFAVHPLRVESVAWIAERKDVLSGLFWMLTLWAYIAYVRRPAISRYLLVLLLFALGLMAKPMLVTLPCVLLLLDYWPLCRLRWRRRVVVDSSSSFSTASEGAGMVQRSVWYLLFEKVPLFLCVVGSCIVTLFAQQQAIMDLKSLPMKFRFMSALVAYVRYIGKMLWPSNLVVLYPHPRQLLPEWQVWGAGILLFVICVLVLWFGRRHRYLITGWLWFLGTLVPVIGIIQVGLQIIADRYTYIPMIGLALMFTWGLADLLALFPYPTVVRSVAAVPVFIALLISSNLQVHHWRDTTTLWYHAAAVDPDNYLAHQNLGAYYRNHGQEDLAIQHFSELMRIRPDHAQWYSDVGIDLWKQGRTDEAMSHFSSAVQINPKLWVAQYNLGVAYESRGKFKEAADCYRQAVNLAPETIRYRRQLAYALQEIGQTEEAIREYDEAVRINPDWLKVVNHAAWISATNLEPALRDGKQALKLAKQVCQATAFGNPKYLDTLAAAYAEDGQFEPAVENAEIALKLAESKNESELVDRIRVRLSFYENHQPFRDPGEENAKLESKLK